MQQKGLIPHFGSAGILVNCPLIKRALPRNSNAPVHLHAVFLLETLARANANDTGTAESHASAPRRRTRTRPDPATRPSQTARWQQGGSRLAARIFTVKKAQDSARFFISFFTAWTIQANSSSRAACTFKNFRASPLLIVSQTISTTLNFTRLSSIFSPGASFQKLVFQKLTHICAYKL